MTKPWEETWEAGPMPQIVVIEPPGGPWTGPLDDKHRARAEFAACAPNLYRALDELVQIGRLAHQLRPITDGSLLVAFERAEIALKLARGE